MRNKILIVDDSFINRELLTEMLEDEYESLHARTVCRLRAYGEKL